MCMSESASFLSSVIRTFIVAAYNPPAPIQLSPAIKLVITLSPSAHFLYIVQMVQRLGG